MIAKWIDIDNGAWRLVVSYDVTPNDMPYISGQLRAAGATEINVKRAYELFHRPNEAFTLSDPDQRMSVVGVGWTTSRAQRHNSIVHEIYHVVRDICDYYGIERNSEEAAYLQGYLAQQMIL